MLLKLMLVVFLTYAAIVPNAFGFSIMQSKNPSVESIKTEYENDLIVIEGVETISVGLGQDGKKVLMIGVSVPVENIRDKLPINIFSVPVEFVPVGEIDAQ
jgi:flagellar basal body-associated protein FliL